jgi:hypothetical protein
MKDGRMDGWAVITKLTVAFRNFANAPHQAANTVGSYGVCLM